tara:strand:+ start:248 stop:475 length:228 start_codon:yes stop_codon:yes gene_type:complete
MREFEFEDRNYQVHEIKRRFGIKDKTWRIWVYGDGKKKRPIDKSSMGLTKVPGTNYYVVDPDVFQDWFKELCNAK